MVLKETDGFGKQGCSEKKEIYNFSFKALSIIINQIPNMISETCSNSSFTSPWEYDVFLSFKEEDTGKSFTDHLYNALIQKGIFTFRDDDQKLGSLIPSKAIEESRFAIVVFSENYASSTRCLDQLVKIVECKKELRLEAVFPVLYHVDPTQLIEKCGKACVAERQQVFKDNVEKVKKWEGALTEILINLSRSRWDLKDRHETDFIKEIVKDIWEKLNQTCPRGDTELLVGMESRMEKMYSLLDIELDDVRIIGIFGTQGIGKTALAHQVFERVKHKFDAGCTAFIANLSEECRKNGTAHLQKRLYKEHFKIQGYVRNDGPGKNLLRRRLHCKRVLIVLDDVDTSKQIQDLVGNWKVENWLGRGSRVIVTSKNEDSLNQFGKKYIYKVDKLNDDEALQLLRMRAFADNYILDEYKEVCNTIVEIAHRNPLTLVNLGNFLYGRSPEEWSDKIAMLREVEEEDEDEGEE